MKKLLVCSLAVALFATGCSTTGTTGSTAPTITPAQSQQLGTDVGAAAVALFLNRNPTYGPVLAAVAQTVSTQSTAVTLSSIAGLVIPGQNAADIAVVAPIVVDLAGLLVPAGTTASIPQVNTAIAAAITQGIAAYNVSHPQIVTAPAH